MSQEYAPGRPYWTANAADKAALIEELRSLDTQLGTRGERPAPLTWVQESRLTARRDEVKRLLADIASREGSVEAQQRKPAGARLVEVSDDCGRMRPVTQANRLVVPDALEFERCQAEKEFIANAIPRRFMPPTPPAK